MGAQGSIQSIRTAAQNRYERTVKPFCEAGSVFSIKLDELYFAYTEQKLKGSRNQENAFLKGETALYWNWRVLRTLRNMANEARGEKKAEQLFKQLKSAANAIDSFDPEKSISRAAYWDTVIELMCRCNFHKVDIAAVNLFLADFLPINGQVAVGSGEKEESEVGPVSSYGFWLGGKKAGSMRLVESRYDDPPSEGALLQWASSDEANPLALWLDKFAISIDGSMLRALDGWKNAPMAHLSRMLAKMKIDVNKLISDIRAGQTYSAPAQHGPGTTITLQSDLQALPPENFTFRVYLGSDGCDYGLSTEVRVLLGRREGESYFLVPSFPGHIMAIRNNGRKSDRLWIEGVYSMQGSSWQN